MAPRPRPLDAAWVNASACFDAAALHQLGTELGIALVESQYAGDDDRVR
jgi:hypothetical protein